MMRLFAALLLPAAFMACGGPTSSSRPTETPPLAPAPETSADAAAPETLAPESDDPEPVESAPCAGDCILPPRTTGETPILVGGQPTGYYYLKNAGVTIRREVLECPSLVPRTEWSCPAKQRQNATCQTDSDCTEKPNGFCYSSSPFPGVGCNCEYGCKVDADCGQNQICRCRGPVGVCADAACGPTGTCGANGCVARYGIADTLTSAPFDCVKEGEFDPSDEPPE